MLNSIIGDITHDTVRLIYKEARKKRNQRKIAYVINLIADMATSQAQPYFYAIMAILVLLFLMNCFQFFFYVRYIRNLREFAVSSAALVPPNLTSEMV